MPFDRRQLFQASAAAAAGLVVPASLSAIGPIERVGAPHMRLSLAAYSFRQQLDLKKKSMTLFDFIDLAAALPLDAVEFTAYYFASTTPEYLGELKGRCTRLGLDVSGTAIGNNFCVTNPAELKKQIDGVKKWIEHTSLLGGKTIRIFAGSLGKGQDEEKAVAQAVAAIEEACEHAAKFGIYLALENHGGITATPEQLLGIVKAVKSPWFGVNLDSGNFHTQDPYADLAKIAPYAVIAQFKTEVHPAGKKKEEADLAKLVEMMRAVKYRGYITLEYEADEDPKAAIPKALATLRRLVS